MDKQIEIIAKNIVAEIEDKGLQDNGDAQDFIIMQAIEENGLEEDAYDEIVEAMMDL
jgi:hypothetical protein